MSNLRERYHKETNSALKARYILESQEMLEEAPNPAALTDTLVAGREQFKKVQQLLAAIPNDKLGTLRAAVGKANASITNPKFTNACMAMLVSLESLFGYMGKIMQTFDEAENDPQRPLEEVLKGQEGDAGAGAGVVKAAKKIISQSLTPNGKIAAWVGSKLGKSFITGSEAEKIAEEFLWLSYDEFKSLQAKSRDIAAAKVGTKAAQAAGQTKPEATPDGQAAGTPPATAGTNPAAPTGATAPGTAPASPAPAATTPPSAQTAVDALEKAGVNLKGMSEDDKRKFFEEMMKSSSTPTATT